MVQRAGCEESDWFIGQLSCMYWASSPQEGIALLITAFQTLKHFQITEGQQVMLNLGFSILTLAHMV